MVTGRGRVNKTASKSKTSSFKPTAKQKKTGINTAGLLGKGKSLLGLVGGVKSSRGSGFTHKKTAKQRLRTAYEKRANLQIRQGNLGQARRTLRKKLTVV